MDSIINLMSPLLSPNDVALILRNNLTILILQAKLINLGDPSLLSKLSEIEQTLLQLKQLISPTVSITNQMANTLESAKSILIKMSELLKL